MVNEYVIVVCFFVLWVLIIYISLIFSDIYIFYFLRI